MTDSELYKTIAESLGIAEASPEQRLSEDLGLTSMHLLYAAIQLEKKLGVRFDGMHASDLKTIEDLAAHIRKKAASK